MTYTYVCTHTGPHDSGTSIIKDGKLSHFIEERFGHKKHAAPPIYSLNYIKECSDEIDHLSFSDSQNIMLSLIDYVKKLNDGLYQVVLSINTIEPDKKKNSQGRPDYVQVKSIPIEDMQLVTAPSLCK